MKNVSFIIDGVELYTEKVLVEFEIPLLFICRDKANKRYSVLCVDSEEERYLIVQSRIRDIVNMIQNTITMKELFLKAKEGIAWMVTAGESFEDDKVVQMSIQDVEDIDLPKDGAFYEVYNADIHDYVDLLLNRVPKKETVEQIVNFDIKLTEQYQVLADAVKAMKDVKEMESAEYVQSFDRIIQNS